MCHCRTCLQLHNITNFYHVYLQVMLQYLHGKEGEVEAVRSLGRSLVEGRGGEEGALVQKNLEELNSRWAKLDQQVLEIWAHLAWRSSN